MPKGQRYLLCRDHVTVLPSDRLTVWRRCHGHYGKLLRGRELLNLIRKSCELDRKPVGYGSLVYSLEASLGYLS